MDKMKKKLIVALSFSMLACGMVGVAGMNDVGFESASANTEAKFEMLSGAGVRIGTQSGIRWTTTLNETFYNTLNVGSNEVELGVLVVPKKNLGDGELTSSTSEVEAIPCSKSITFDANGEFTYYSSIVYDNLTSEEAEKAYAIELTARAYIKVGETYTYVDEYEETTRSMRAVAYEASKNGYTQEQVGKYFGEEQESDIASGYYSAMDESATLTNVNNLADGTYKASVKAQPVEVVVSGATMTVSGKLRELTAGENYELNVFDKNNNVYVQDFMYATLVIDEASDMNLFHHGGKGALTSNYKFDGSAFNEEEDKFDGYYILVKDIDMNESLFATEKSTSRINYIENGQLSGLGLTGTFDGNGHRLYNFSPVYAGGGLFSAVNGGTVKNVSITKDKVSSINDLPYFAGILNGATIENV